MTENQDPTKKFVDLLSKLLAMTPDYDRAVVVTPYNGDYGLQGYVLSINGSPAHGTAILDLDRQFGIAFPDISSGDRATKKISAAGFGPKTLPEQVWAASVELITELGLPVIAQSQVAPQSKEVKIAIRPTRRLNVPEVMTPNELPLYHANIDDD